MVFVWIVWTALFVHESTGLFRIQWSAFSFFVGYLTHLITMCSSLTTYPNFVIMDGFTQMVSNMPMTSCHKTERHRSVTGNLRVSMKLFAGILPRCWINLWSHIIPDQYTIPILRFLRCWTQINGNHPGSITVCFQVTLVSWSDLGCPRPLRPWHGRGERYVHVIYI